MAHRALCNTIFDYHPSLSPLTPGITYPSHHLPHPLAPKPSHHQPLPITNPLPSPTPSHHPPLPTTHPFPPPTPGIIYLLHHLSAASLTHGMTCPLLQLPGAYLTPGIAYPPHHLPSITFPAPSTPQVGRLQASAAGPSQRPKHAPAQAASLQGTPAGYRGALHRAGVCGGAGGAGSGCGELRLDCTAET